MHASAQEEGKDNVIKFNPLSILVRSLNVSYERKLSERYGFQTGYTIAGFSQAGTDVKGNVVTLELKCYLNDEALSGFYLSSFIKRQGFSLQDLKQKGSYVSYGFGAAVGKQRVYGNNLSLDMILGPGYNFGQYYPLTGPNKMPLIISGLDRFSLRVAILIGLGL